MDGQKKLTRSQSSLLIGEITEGFQRVLAVVNQFSGLLERRSSWFIGEAVQWFRDPWKKTRKARTKKSCDTTQKSCVDCQTSKTPLWRGGPAGPKSLCNACGIRYRKKRRVVLGLKKEESDHEMIKKEKKRDHHKIQIQINNKKNNNHKISRSLKLRLLAFGREVILQRSASMGSSTQRQQLGEEEQLEGIRGRDYWFQS